MKNIFSFFSREHLEESVSIAWRRFPLPTLLVILITGAFLYVVNESPDEMIFARIIFTLIVTFFISV
jgi:hypothetical protein